MFQESLATLKMAKTKFAGSKDAVEQINAEWKSKEILVPLTGSMYVPGVIKEIDNLVIDVGTGYYAEMVRQCAFDENGCLTSISMRAHTGHRPIQGLLQAQGRIRAGANGQNRLAGRAKE